MNTKKKAATKKTTQGAPAAKQDTRTAKSATATKTAAQERPQTPTKATSPEELVVFAFRLTLEERKAIHKAAGPGKASKFVRSLATHAARGDIKVVTAMIEAARGATTKS